MKKRLLLLILPIITLILEILPYGAVCNFAMGPGQSQRKLFSYFDLVPFGYANFAPFLTALATCVTSLLLLLWIIKGNKGLYAKTKTMSVVAAILSLCPLLLGVNYYSVVGGLITFSLAAECVLLFAFEKKACSVR